MGTSEHRGPLVAFALVAAFCALSLVSAVTPGDLFHTPAPIADRTEGPTAPRTVAEVPAVPEAVKLPTELTPVPLGTPEVAPVVDTTATAGTTTAGVTTPGTTSGTATVPSVPGSAGGQHGVVTKHRGGRRGSHHHHSAVRTTGTGTSTTRAGHHGGGGTKASTKVVRKARRSAGTSHHQVGRAHHQVGRTHHRRAKQQKAHHGAKHHHGHGRGHQRH